MSNTEQDFHHNWVLLLHLGDNAWVGLLDDSLWVGDDRRPKRAVDLENPVGLLPLLERSLGAVVADLAGRERALGLSDGYLADRVPLAAVPYTAFDTHIDYWIQLALNWLSATPASEVDESALERLTNEPLASQRARHRAESLRRRGWH